MVISGGKIQKQYSSKPLAGPARVQRIPYKSRQKRYLLLCQKAEMHFNGRAKPQPFELQGKRTILEHCNLYNFILLSCHSTKGNSGEQKLQSSQLAASRKSASRCRCTQQPSGTIKAASATISYRLMKWKEKYPVMRICLRTH